MTPDKTKLELYMEENKLSEEDVLKKLQEPEEEADEEETEEEEESDADEEEEEQPEMISLDEIDKLIDKKIKKAMKVKRGSPPKQGEQTKKPKTMTLLQYEVKEKPLE